MQKFEVDASKLGSIGVASWWSRRPAVRAEEGRYLGSKGRKPRFGAIGVRGGDSYTKKGLVLSDD